MTPTEIISILTAFAALITSVGAFLANRGRIKVDKQDAAASLVKASTDLIEPLQKRIEELVRDALTMKALIDSLETRLANLVEENASLRTQAERCKALLEEHERAIEALQAQVKRLWAVPVVPAQW